jgi:hypothetical protein
VLLNFGDRELPVPRELLPPDATVLLSTHVDRDGAGAAGLVLRSHEGLILGTPAMAQG